MILHIGLVKDGENLIVQAASTVDALSCETWKYCGQRQTTVVELRGKLLGLLHAVNRLHNQSFKTIELEDKDGE